MQILNYKNISNNLYFSIFFISVIRSTWGANILDLSELPSKSHFLWHKNLLYGLSARGHNITFLSADLDDNSPKNVHYLHLDGVNEKLNVENSTELLNFSNLSQFAGIDGLIDFILIACEAMMTSTGFKKILSYPNDFKFDLVLYDNACGPCLIALQHKFNYPPLVSITAFNAPPNLIGITGGHVYPAYTPFFTVPYGADMNFWQRVLNGMVYAYYYYLEYYVQMPETDKIVKKYFDENIPPLSEIRIKTILSLVNTHPALDIPIPLPPNIIPVAGLHIKETKPLPQDIEGFINSSKNGTVLFALGTSIESRDLSSDVHRKFIDAFRQLPDYNFLWKYESDKLNLKIEQPKNLLIKKWLPQNDILAHPNIRAFITHGGLLSSQEATWHGVPMVGMPFIVDQYRNIHISEQAGVAEQISVNTLTTQEIKEKLLLVLENPTYRDNMKKRSAQFRDQIDRPLDRAIWWIEWAIRNSNADHMQSPVKVLGHIRSNYLDVIGLFIGIAILLIFLPAKLILLIYGNRRKTDNDKIKKH